MATTTLDQDSIDGIAEALTKSLKQTGNTPSGGGSNNALKNLTKDSKAFAGSLINTNSRVSDVTSAFTKLGKDIPLLGGIFKGGIDGFVGYLEESYDVYSQLSKVGSGASGSLMDLRMMAADARLGLGEFAGLVQRNSELLAGFAGGVEGGTRHVAALGNAMFETGVVDQFMMLGYSVEEANEFILKNTAITRRQAMLEGMTVQEQVAQAANLAKSMQVMAKLTGKQADQLADELQAQMADGSVRAKLRMLEKQGITGASEAFSQAMVGMKGASAAQKLAMKEIMTLGAPVSEAAKNFVAANQESAAMMYQVKRAAEAGDVEGARKAGEQSMAASVESMDSMQNLFAASVASVSEFGETQKAVLEETANVVDQVLANQKQMETATGKSVSLTEAFNATLANLKTEVDSVTRGTGPNQEELKAYVGVQKAITDEAAGIQKNIALTVKTLDTLQDGLSTASDGAVKAIHNLTSGINAGINLLGNLTGDAADETMSNIAAAGGQEAAEAYKTFISSQSSLAEKQEALALLQEKNITDHRGILNAELKAKVAETTIKNADAAIEEGIAKEEGEVLDKSKINEEPGWVSELGRWINTIIPRATGGPLNLGDVALVGEEGPEIFKPKSAGDIIPADITSQLSSLGPQLGNQFSNIASQLEQEMKAFGAPMTEASKEMAAKMAPKMKDLAEQAGPDLIQMMQQLIEINRKTMQNTDKQYKLTTDRMRGI